MAQEEAASTHKLFCATESRQRTRSNSITTFGSVQSSFDGGLGLSEKQVDAYAKRAQVLLHTTPSAARANSLFDELQESPCGPSGSSRIDGEGPEVQAAPCCAAGSSSSSSASSAARRRTLRAKTMCVAAFRLAGPLRPPRP